MNISEKQFNNTFEYWIRRKQEIENKITGINQLIDKIRSNDPNIGYDSADIPDLRIDKKVLQGKHMLVIQVVTDLEALKSSLGNPSVRKPDMNIS